MSRKHPTRERDCSEMLEVLGGVLMQVNNTSKEKLYRAFLKSLDLEPEAKHKENIIMDLNATLQSIVGLACRGSRLDVIPPIGGQGRTFRIYCPTTGLIAPIKALPEPRQDNMHSVPALVTLLHKICSSMKQAQDSPTPGIGAEAVPVVVDPLIFVGSTKIIAFVDGSEDRNQRVSLHLEGMVTPLFTWIEGIAPATLVNPLALARALRDLGGARTFGEPLMSWLRGVKWKKTTEAAVEGQVGRESVSRSILLEASGIEKASIEVVVRVAKYSSALLMDVAEAPDEEVQVRLWFEACVDEEKIRVSVDEVDLAAAEAQGGRTVVDAVTQFAAGIPILRGEPS